VRGVTPGWSRLPPQVPYERLDLQSVSVVRVMSPIRVGPAEPRARVAAGSPASAWRLLVLACLGLAVLSLLLPSSPTYDPWAWLIWGREIAHGELVTTGGPSWKPLPVLFTAPFSLLGNELAPLAWLVVARAGGLLAIAMAYRVATRVAGPAAGAIAALALVLCDGFLFNVVRGNSEGLLVAACLWAVERHLDGRRVDTFLLGVAAALLRPEVWPFLAIYAVVLLLRSDRSWRTRAIVAASAFGVLALWFVPEYVGSGDPLRAASRARQPNLNAAAFDAHPFLAVLERSAPLLTAPVYVGAAVAVVVALRRRDRFVLGLAAAAIGLVLIVAVMTEAGFAGNLRYVALPASLICVLSGVGWVWLAGIAARTAGPVGIGAVAVGGGLLALPAVAADLRTLDGDAERMADEAAIDASLPDAIAAAGGRAAILACPPVITGSFQTQVIAWQLELRETEVEVDSTPTPPGTVVALEFTAMSRYPGFTPVGRSEHWIVGTSCR
jgi:hypothetical protein